MPERQTNTLLVLVFSWELWTIRKRVTFIFTLTKHKDLTVICGFSSNLRFGNNVIKYNRKIHISTRNSCLCVCIDLLHPVSLSAARCLQPLDSRPVMTLRTATVTSWGKALGIFEALMAGLWLGLMGAVVIGH